MADRMTAGDAYNRCKPRSRGECMGSKQVENALERNVGEKHGSRLCASTRLTVMLIILAQSVLHLQSFFDEMRFM